MLKAANPRVRGFFRIVRLLRIVVFRLVVEDVIEQKQNKDNRHAHPDSNQGVVPQIAQKVAEEQREDRHPHNTELIVRMNIRPNRDFETPT